MTSSDQESFFGDDPVRVYAGVLEAVPPLERAEELHCIQQIRAGEEHAQSAHKRLFEGNLRLVVPNAERYQNGRIHLLELIVKGNEALEDALWTLGPNDTVAAHATPYVERAIADAAAG